MRIDYLDSFIELAHSGNFSHAAKRLHITQSVLSKQISLMEKEFGVPLFTRKRPHVELTEQGRILYKKAYIITEQYRQARDELAKYEKNELDILCYGGFHRNAAIAELVSNVLYQIEEQKLDFSLDKKVHNDKPFFEQLDEGCIDILFTTHDPADNSLDEAYEAHFLFNNRAFALMHKNHHLAQKEKLRLEDLSSETVLLPSGMYSLPYMKIIEHKLQALSTPPIISPVLFRDINDYTKVVLKDEIIFISSSLYETFRFSSSVVAVPVVEADLVFPTYAITVRNTDSKSLKTCIDLILEEANKTIPGRIL